MDTIDDSLINEYKNKDFHTVIGTLKWSAEHVKKLQNNRPDVWGGVFCISYHDFIAHRKSYCYQLNEFSFLGDINRVDFFQRLGKWSNYLWEPEASEENKKAYSLLPQIEKRFPFFYNLSVNKINLDRLNSEYELVIFKTKEEPSTQKNRSFWTFQKKGVKTKSLENKTHA
ncbi:MAG: hypothetical protein HQK79_19890 [Desulfobacterales bacterium]|nr:hypothetical protein [Desulfobacterales bacterium]